jgi:hypothetical protein
MTAELVTPGDAESLVDQVAAEIETLAPLSSRQRVTIEQVVAAYRETGSVWKAGARLGVAGQTVHERLRAVGYPIAARRWTSEETAELQRLIDNGVPLAEVAHRLGRTYAGVACRASRTGSKSTPVRRRKIPRGAGYDKVSVGKHLKVIETGKLRPTQYARAQGLEINALVSALQKHYAERWQVYLASHDPLPGKTCEYCDETFIPANGKQRFCTRQCSITARADAGYFGGKRRETVGLAEGRCQLCARTDVKGLSSHHVLGKENDPLNDVLIALCHGCHQIVTLLGARTFTDDPRAWEALISLAWMRRHGAELAIGTSEKVVYTEVTIEISEADEWDDADAEMETWVGRTAVGSLS